MNENYLYTLLDIISKNGNVKKLIFKGLTYKSIGELNTWAIDNNFLEINNNEIRLSKKGEEEYHRLSISFRKTNKEEWILPEIESRISKIDKDFIYLPNKNELSF